MGAQARPRRRLRHRMPVSLRHYWKLIAGSIAAVAALAVAIGSLRVSAVVYSDAAEGFTVNWDVQGTEDLFDTSVAHEIDLEYSDTDYEEMVEEFQDSGEKKWIKADITIDGTTVEDVGIRLKGNSTLSGLGGGGQGGMGGMQPPEGMEDGMFPGATGEEGAEAPADAQAPDATAEEDAQEPEIMRFPGGGQGGGMGTSLSFDSPESLPWLVDFGKFIDGQVYQGNQRISLRVESAMGGSTLTEAVAMELVEAGGEPSYDWTYSAVSVDGSDAVTRRVVDIMDVTWVEDEFGEDAGVLYKARAGGQFSYQGEDPEEYEDDFKQINMEGSADAQPLIDFLEWLDGADDAAFGAELGEWVDLESFANYTALQNLLANGDDMSGPGGNFYLWYDYGTGLISIVSWDLDLSLTSAELAPDDTASMTGGMGGAGAMPEGTEPPEGFEMPEGMEIPEGAETQDGEGREVRVFGGSAGASDFKQRFLDNAAFFDRYMEAYGELYEQLYASGAALEAVDSAAAAAELNGADVAEAADSLRTTVRERAEFLASELGAE